MNEHEFGIQILQALKQQQEVNLLVKQQMMKKDNNDVYMLKEDFNKNANTQRLR